MAESNISPEPAEAAPGTAPVTAAPAPAAPAPAAVQPPPQDGGFGPTELLEAGGEEQPPAAPRRPLGTGRLLLAALLVGPLLGGSIGYAVQAARPATPLPELKTVALQYPAVPADAADAAEAVLKPLEIDGDLRKLLVAKPDGAEAWDNYGRGDDSGWLSPGEKAMSYGGADNYFRRLLGDGFRRDAVVAWRKGDVKWRVELIQYQSDRALSAGAATLDLEGGSVTALPGTANGLYTAPAEARTYSESTEKYYYGLASARRGDLVMRISVYSPSQVNADELKDVAKRQWERLV
ncbi:hypothetical protein [Kitasatospora sp. NPDC002040]|uniref:hypothetical protein n=1 Tax=Kitasatospora sp. NPDC002040 TaxID=3154661 RepID=UPI00332F9CEC